MSDDWLTPFDGSGIAWHESLPNPYTYKESDFSALVAAVHEYECVVIDARRALEKIRKRKINLESFRLLGGEDVQTFAAGMSEAYDDCRAIAARALAVSPADTTEGTG